MTPRKTSAARAFTLIELLAATAMMALVAGSLYACLHIAFKARDTALHSVETVRRCDAAFSMMKDDLQSATVPGGAMALAGPFVGISGSVGIGSSTDTPGLPSLAPVGQGASMFGTVGDRLSFYSTAADVEANAPIGDIKRIEFGLEPLPDSSAVILVRRLTVNLLAPAPVIAEEMICPDVSSLTLRYFDGSAWQNSWDSNSTGNVLPAAVEVTLELAGPAAISPAGGPYRMTRVIPVAVGVTTGGSFVGTSSSSTPSSTTP